MAKVTVILAIYNVEKYLEKCLNSLLDQTFDDISILTIDDGSPDNSLSILKKYSKISNKIKYIKQDNGGYGSAIETALNNVDTKYFLICDPDDWLKKDCIEKLYRSAEENDVDMTIADTFYVYGNSVKSEYRRGTHRNYNIEPYKKYNDITSFTFFSPTPHAKLFKTELARHIKFPHHTSYTDTLLFLLCLNNCKSIYYINEPLAYYYFDRPGNTAENIFGTTYGQKTFNDQMTVINSTIQQLNNQKKIKYVIYYRLYVEITSIISRLKSIKDGNYQENCATIYNSLSSIEKYHNLLYKEIRDNNLVKLMFREILIRLLFYKKTRMMTIKFLANLYKK